MPSADERRQAWLAGKAAFRAGQHPFTNPHTPIPPGELLLARLWRAGWHAAKREDRGENE